MAAINHAVRKVSFTTTVEPRYDRITMILHWLTALLVVSLWGIAQVIDFFPRGSPRVDVRSVHMVLGITLGLVLLARILWRAGFGRGLPDAEAGLLGLAARAVHYLLYGLVFATVLLGLANASLGGDSFFNLFALPAFPGANGNLARSVNGLHGTFANAVLIVAGLHALAALFHHYVRRDGVLRRMLPE